MLLSLLQNDIIDKILKYIEHRVVFIGGNTFDDFFDLAMIAILVIISIIWMSNDTNS